MRKVDEKEYYTPKQIADCIKKNGKIMYDIAIYFALPDNYDTYYTAFFMMPFRSCSDYIIHVIENDSRKTIYVKGANIVQTDIRKFVEDCFVEIAKLLVTNKFHMYSNCFLDDEYAKTFDERSLRV